MKTIVCASDLSERGDAAVARAVSIAKTQGAHLIVASVVDEDLPEAAAEALMREAGSHLAKITKDAPDGTEVRVVRGDPAPTIARLADTEGADLLVIGRHRPRPIADLMRQTTVERILRAACCPALVVSDGTAAPYRSVLAMVDFSPASAAALRAVAAVAPEASLHAIHAVHVPSVPGRGPADEEIAASFVRTAEAERAAFFDRERLPDPAPEVTIVTGSTHAVLDTQMARHGVDLVALGAHSRSGLHLLTLGSFAHDLVRHPPADLLIARGS